MIARTPHPARARYRFPAGHLLPQGEKELGALLVEFSEGVEQPVEVLVGMQGGDGQQEVFGLAAQLEDEAMISLNQIEGQMRASSLRKLTDIVGKHPDETLTIMRGWMAQENG